MGFVFGWLLRRRDFLFVENIANLAYRSAESQELKNVTGYLISTPFYAISVNMNDGMVKRICSLYLPGSVNKLVPIGRMWMCIWRTRKDNPICLATLHPQVRLLTFQSGVGCLECQNHLTNRIIGKFLSDGFQFDIVFLQHVINDQYFACTFATECANFSYHENIKFVPLCRFEHSHELLTAEVRYRVG